MRATYSRVGLLVWKITAGAIKKQAKKGQKKKSKRAPKSTGRREFFTGGAQAAAPMPAARPACEKAGLP
jgi:hypothetical protein